MLITNAIKIPWCAKISLECMCSALTTQAAFTKRKKPTKKKTYSMKFFLFGGSWRSASAASAAAPFAHNKTKGQLPCMHCPGTLKGHEVRDGRESNTVVQLHRYSSAYFAVGAKKFTKHEKQA